MKTPYSDQIAPPTDCPAIEKRRTVQGDAMTSYYISTDMDKGEARRAAFRAVTLPSGWLACYALC